MSAKPGEIMGYLAYGHPFLDGNGRAIMTVHSVLAQRAGFSIDWSATRKDAYLDALTKEIENPPKGHLDADLRPFMRDPIAYEQLPTAIVQAPGLDGGAQDAALTRFSATSTSHVSGLNTRQCWRSAKEFEIDRFHPRSAPWMEFFDTIEYAGGIEMAPNNFVHAIRKLPVRFTPQRSA